MDFVSTTRAAVKTGQGAKSSVERGASALQEYGIEQNRLGSKLQAFQTSICLDKRSSPCPILYIFFYFSFIFLTFSLMVVSSAKGVFLQ